MYSNYNVLVLPIDTEKKFKEGDIYKAPDTASMQIRKFDGLKIETIDFNYGVRLHFDFEEWRCNRPAPSAFQKLEAKSQIKL